MLREIIRTVRSEATLNSCLFTIEELHHLLLLLPDDGLHAGLEAAAEEGLDKARCCRAEWQRSDTVALMTGLL